MNTSIKKAVFPIAGLGTRFLPVTKASPKEMLPIVDKPLIQYAVEEAYEAGIRQMIFVTGRTKRSVEDHFDTAVELEKELENKGNQPLLELVRSIKPNDMECIYVRQQKALGLGHAILCAENLIENNPFAVLLADDLMVGRPAVLTQMIKQYQALNASIIAVEHVDRAHTSRYGIVVGEFTDVRLMKMSTVVEKPEPQSAPSTLAIAGRYIFTPSIFKKLKCILPDRSGEIQLTEGIDQLLQNESVYAYQFEGVRYDCGSKLGFLQASVELGLQHTEIGESFGAWINRHKVG